MEGFDFEFLLRIRRRQSGEFLSDNEIKLLNILDSGRTLSEASKELDLPVERIEEIVSKLNQDAIYVSRDNDFLALTEEGRELVNNIIRLREVLVFYTIHPYVRSAVTVDGIISYGNKIVLIERKNEPYKGMIALPGGYVTYGEKVEEALLREMREEIGREVLDEKLFSVVSAPSRDPRGHTISLVFTGRVDEMPEAGDDASKIILVEKEEIEKLEMAFDHQQILKEFIQHKV